MSSERNKETDCKLNFNSKTKGRLLFFDDALLEENSSESSADEDSDIKKTVQKDVSFISKAVTTTNETLLPSANNVLDNKSELKFLKKHIDLNMDTFAKNTLVEKEKEKELAIINSNTHAVPPPKAYEPLTEKLKPTLGDNTVEKRAAEGVNNSSYFYFDGC